MLGKIKYVLKKNLNMKTSYVVGITVLSLFLVVGGISVALYTSQAESRGSLNIVTGELASLMESEDLSDQKLTIKGNEEKIITVAIKNSNNIDMKFNLYYTPVEGVEVKYYEDYDIPPKEEGEIINKNQIKKYTLSIKNKNSSDKEIIFGSDVGLKSKNLPFPEGKKIINQRKIDVVKDDNMTPVVYDENKNSWVVANDENWYDYDHQKWANAVTLDKTKVLDLSGNNNHGTLNNGVKIENGEATFDGKDDYIDAGLKNYDFKTEATLIIKFQPLPAINKNSIFTLIGNVDGGGIAICYDHGKLVMRYFSEEGNHYVDAGANIDLNVGTEYTVVANYDGEIMKLYVNGTVIGETNVKMTIREVGAPIFIGAEPNVGTFGCNVNIQVSDALIFNQGLSDEEIQAHYSGEVSLGETKPLAYYDFENGSNIQDEALIPMDLMETMWVYIPRYSYTIGSEDGVNYFGKKGEFLENTPTRELPGEFDIKFISTNQKEKEVPQYKVKDGIKGWYTPDGFTFGEKELPGVWIGKFETSSSNPSASNGGDNVTDLDPMIKPNITNWRSIQLANAEEVSVKMTQSGNRYGFSQKFDAHLTKNSEWALATYLSQSKYGKLGNSAYSGVNKEIYPNKDETYKTGCSYGQALLDPTENIEFICHYSYDNIPNGTGASTTGTIYGIYDMSGGSWEYTAGNYFVDGKHYTALSGYKGYNQDIEVIEGKEFLADKYYDFYKTDNPLTACNNESCYSHGLNEVENRYSDASNILNTSAPWYVRGGQHNWPNTNGIFAYGYSDGRAEYRYSFRIALVEN